MPRVSIIIPAYNAARYLPAAIDSVLAQTYADWEIIVIDDGSTDGTRSVAQSYGPNLGARLRYVYQANQGVSAARNRGIREARGEFLAILDADDVWLPTRLARGVAVMDDSPRVGLVHSRIGRMGPDGQIIYYRGFLAKYQSGMIARDLFTRRANILSATVLLRKRCLEDVGYFDETMQTCEDRDLWFRLAERYEVAYIDEILAHYRVDTGGATSHPDRMLKGQLFFVRKHYNRGACSWMALCRALAQIYREQGDFFFAHRQVRKSITYYFRSVMYNPFHPLNVYMLGRACAEPVLGGALAAHAFRRLGSKVG
jgi:glycosyltransferase involved in cell wall biosynthesis